MSGKIYARLSDSNSKAHRYMVKLYKDANAVRGDTHFVNINFGSPDYENYTIHNDDERKASYYQRHPQSSDPLTAQFWANNLLWNKKSITDSIRDIQARYNIQIINEIKKR